MVGISAVLEKIVYISGETQFKRYLECTCLFFVQLCSDIHKYFLMCKKKYAAQTLITASLDSKKSCNSYKQVKNYINIGQSYTHCKISMTLCN